MSDSKNPNAKQRFQRVKSDTTKVTAGIVFDTQALLKLYLGESGADEVEDMLNLVLEKKIKGYMNLVNLAELYYVLCRVNETTAQEKERNLRSFGVKIVSVRDNSNLWRHAALIKAQHSMSLADAFGAATALGLNATLLTGADLEFGGIKKLKIKRI